MEEVSVQIETPSLDKTAMIIVDIERPAPPPDRSTGSPRLKRALSRKWSCRAERPANTKEEDIDDPSAKKSLILKVNPQLEPLKQPLITNKVLNTRGTANLSGSNLLDGADGWNRWFNRLIDINPRKILFIFATVSSMGTLILIYFALAINR